MKQAKVKKYKCLPWIAPLILSLFVLSNNTLALEYQSNTNVQFTFNPIIAIDISGNLTIDKLSPGTASDSNIINVNVATNNVTGYNLSATVGSTSNASSDLVHNSGNGYKFSSLNSNLSTLTDFDPNTWGYNYSVNSSSDWHDYSTLPLYTAEGVTLNSTTTATNDTIRFKIGARADNAQASGTYTNTINFATVANPAPYTFAEAFAAAGKQQHNGYYAMQDMSNSICEAADIDTNIQLLDLRDSNVYLIGKLADNNCWMLDNLRLDPTDSTTAANMTSSNTNAPAAAITNYLNGSSTAPQSGWSTTAVFNSATNAWTNYYDVPEINIAFGSNTKDSVVPAHYGAGSGKRGTYYNFCAATAGTYCWASGAGKDLPDTIVDAPYDICPAGWHMPTGGVRKNDTEQVDTGEIGDYQTLCNILNGPNCTNGMSMTATNQNSLQYKLGLPLSGYLYSDTQNSYGSLGRWWSSTYYNGYAMYYLTVNSGNVWPMNANNRYYGFTMRCVVGS